MVPASAVILLVEDNDDDADLTIRALRQHKVANDIVRLADGVEALDYLTASGAHTGRNRHDTPEVVLLDLKLPRVNGLEVLRALRDDAINRHVPVVVLTSSIERRDLDAAYELGANSYVQKPVDFKQFTQAVANIGHYWLLLNQPPNRI